MSYELALAAKYVESGLLNTWFQGTAISSLITDKSGALSAGQALDLGDDETGPTVHESEEADPEAVTLNRNQLVINIKKFVNRAISMQQWGQLLNGQFKDEIGRSNGGYYRNSCDETIISRILASMSASRHVNLTVGAVTKTFINRAEARAMSAPGVQEGDCFWLASPGAAAEMGALYNDNNPPSIQEAANMGKAPPRTLNGSAIYRHMGVPGFKRRRKAIGASVIASDVMTVSMVDAEGNADLYHGYVVGQRIRTTGLLANATAAVVTVVSGADVSFAYTPGGNVADNGTGFLENDTCMALLICRPRVYCGFDNIIPISNLVKREGAAGYAHQLWSMMGVYCRSGSVYALHTDLVEDD